jgi:hypothetical protein
LICRAITVVEVADIFRRYLARYIHRVAVTNSRIISAENNKVIFRYKDYGGARTRTMTVSAEEFIRRFLQHVLPAGVHKVRYYGLLSPSNRKKLRKLQKILIPSVNNQRVGFEEDNDAQVSAPSAGVGLRLGRKRDTEGYCRKEQRQAYCSWILNHLQPF